MGRTFRKIESEMELEKVKIELNKIGSRLALETNNVECYLFGSILTSPKQANDIDVLILYDNGKQIQDIKREFNEIEHTHPIHMNYFTFEEDDELNFSSRQRAEIIFKI